MYTKTISDKREMHKKTALFEARFANNVQATPPGVCPISIQRALLAASRSQSCGKCVPCRDGLEQVENLMKRIADGNGTEETLEAMITLAKMIEETADCAIGYEAARLVLASVETFRDEYESHVKHKMCLSNVGQTVPCISYCPANVDIPGYIALISEERYADAINLIRRDNPFPTTCAFICEHPCEDKCRRGLIDSAINIRGLKKYAVDQVHVDQVQVPERNVDTGKHVAIIGGGPSGLTTAYFLALMGHRITVFEGRKKLGGMLRYGIPNYRLPKDRLDEDIKGILSAGNIEIKYETKVGEDISLEEILRTYDAAYLSIGAQGGRSLTIEGSESEDVLPAVELLSQIGNGNLPDYTGKKVVIVGGGNVAMDCARSAIRCHADEVTIVCRERQVDMTALPTEIQGALEEGVELRTMHAPVRIHLDEEGHVKSFVVKPQMISEYDSFGMPGLRESDREELEIPCNVVLMAIGQMILSEPFEAYSVDPRRRVFQIEPTALVQNQEKLFAGGDCVFGPATVIKAIGAGKTAAINIDEYLGYQHKLRDNLTIPEPRENDRTHIGRVYITEKSARERKKNFDAVENGMSHAEAMQECRKCLRCDHFGCGVLEGGRV